MKTRISLFMSGIVLILLACNGPTANSQSFVQAVERAKPAVVMIRTYDAYGKLNTFFGFAGGSGIIIDKDKGYILTNYHVIAYEEADAIFATLPDGRSFKATIVGYDHLSDVAVLKINPPEDMPLQEIEWGDSDNVQIGESAIAIGYPYLFNLQGSQQDAVSWYTVGTGRSLYGLTIELLQPSVSVGVVSSTDKIMLGEIEGKEYLHTNLIQTDASINRGNSGGALVNKKGQLIGINTWSKGAQGGGSIGINFAISANTAKKICDQLIDSGYVALIYLGIGTQSVTPNLKVQRNLDLPSVSGVYVSEVEDDGPAFTAGIKPGDVIISISGKTIKNEQHLRAIVRLLPINKEVVCRVIRDGILQEITLRPTFTSGIISSGIRVAQPNRETAKNYTHRGVIITDVEQESLLAKEGLMPGDLIYQINHKKIHTLEDYNTFQNMLRQENVKIKMYIERKGWYKAIEFN